MLFNFSKQPVTAVGALLAFTQLYSVMSSPLNVMYCVWCVIYVFFLIFLGLPSNFWDQDYTPPSHPPCIIDHLCKKHDGISVEAKGIKEYSWKIHIKKLFDTGVSVFAMKVNGLFIEL